MANWHHSHDLFISDLVLSYCDRSKYMPFAVTGVVQFEEEPLLYSVPDAWPCYQTIPSLLVRTNP